jgi:hypothetical protein
MKLTVTDFMYCRLIASIQTIQIVRRIDALDLATTNLHQFGLEVHVLGFLRRQPID